MNEIFDVSYNEIEVIKNLWEENRQYHESTSQYFRESYRYISFEERIKVFENKTIKITVAKSDDGCIGYCISTIIDGQGEIESLHVDEHGLKKIIAE